MPVELQNLIDAWYPHYGYCKADMYNCGGDIYDLGNYIGFEDWVNAEAECDEIGWKLQQASIHIHSSSTQESISHKMYNCLSWINDNWPAGGGEVTMDAILSAMVTATFEQLQYFIGLVDAYRVAVWNEPFNAEFYSALARGFTP